MIVMSAETAAIQRKLMDEAVREAAPATKADVDRLFDEVRRLQDMVSVLLRGSAPEVEHGSSSTSQQGE